MVDTVSTNGGYVWTYLPDLSLRWGEMEARSTMISTQSPGTSSMGHLFLDTYHATGDEYYYQAAEWAASMLIWGQHPSGRQSTGRPRAVHDRGGLGTGRTRT